MEFFLLFLAIESASERFLCNFESPVDVRKIKSPLDLIMYNKNDSITRLYHVSAAA